MSQGVIILKPHRLNRIHRLFPELYRNDFYQIRGNPQPGDLVRLISDDGDFAGIGYYNPHSQIIVRVLTLRDEPIDGHFFRKRFEEALQRRRHMAFPGNTWRLVHGFADGLPGLFIDRIGETLLMQATTYYMNTHREQLAEEAARVFGAKEVLYFTHKDESEKLPETEVALMGNPPNYLEVQEAEFTWNIPWQAFYRTFFPDEREMRRQVAELTRDAESVLDVFAGIGSVGCYLAGGGRKKRIVAIEPDAGVLQQAQQFCGSQKEGNAIEWVQEEVLEALYRLQGAAELFDVVLIHPPFETRDVRQYKHVKWKYWYYIFHALPLLKPGGILLVSTRSAHFSRENLLQTVSQAASGRGMPIFLRQNLLPPPDYPYLVQYDKTCYLKVLLFQT